MSNSRKLFQSKEGLDFYNGDSAFYNSVKRFKNGDYKKPVQQKSEDIFDILDEESIKNFFGSSFDYRDLLKKNPPVYSSPKRVNRRSRALEYVLVNIIIGLRRFSRFLKKLLVRSVKKKRNKGK